MDIFENEQKENRLLVEGLARAAREIEPTLWLGRSLQLLQWISAGQESIALRLKELDEPQAIGRSLVRRSQDDITEALDALLLRLSSSSGPGAGIEREALSPVIDRTRQGLEAAERVLALLRIEPVDLPASASEAHQCAARLEEATGLLETLASRILRLVRSTGSLIAVTLATSFGVNVLASDQYIAIVLPGRMFRSEYERRQLAPKNLSRTLEDAGTLTSVLVPWNTCGAFMAQTLGVSTFSYAPFAVFNLINPVVAAIYGFAQIGIAPLEVLASEPRKATAASRAQTS